MNYPDLSTYLFSTSCSSENERMSKDIIMLLFSCKLLPFSVDLVRDVKKNPLGRNFFALKDIYKKIFSIKK